MWGVDFRPRAGPTIASETASDPSCEAGCGGPEPPRFEYTHVSPAKRPFYSGGTRIQTGLTMNFSRRRYVLACSIASVSSALLQGFLGFGKEGLSVAY
jgi:hypothetical protein